MTRKVLVLVDTTTYACACIIVGSLYKGFSIFETKLSTFESLCILLTIVYYFFYLHQLFFSHHLPRCDVDHKKKTMTNDSTHKKLFESMFIYQNGHNL
jgi:amino acid permease